MCDAVVGKDAADDPVMLGAVSRPMDLNAVGLGIPFELVEVFIEPAQRVLLDARGKLPQLLPLGNGERLPVPLLTQVPKPLVVHLLVLRRRKKMLGRLGLIYGLAATRGCDRVLRFGFGVTRPKRLRRPLSML